MTDARLTQELAARIFGWRPGPGRYLTGDRRWISASRFRPLNIAADALMLLDQAADDYTLVGGRRGPFKAHVRIGARAVDVTGTQRARTISVAVARALGINVEAEG